MAAVHAGDFRTRIYCPVCHRDWTGVEHNARGKVTHRCSVCKKLIEYDFDNENAREVEATRNAFRK